MLSYTVKIQLVNLPQHSRHWVLYNDSFIIRKTRRLSTILWEMLTKSNGHQTNYWLNQAHVIF